MVEIHKAGTDDGWHGVIEEGGRFPPEKGRYHLYIGLFCPFAHRVNVVRHIKHLQDFISLSVVKAYPKGEEGWRFPASDDEYPNATVDHLFGSTFLHEVYFRADREYKGKYSVPVLWDKKMGTIVNNESAEMLRWLPTAFNPLLPPPLATLDLYPPTYRPAIDALSPWLQTHLNTGVYAAGFARTQAAYDRAVLRVFAALNLLEALVAQNGGPFILGKQMTELDIRAYVTIVRFDVVYVQHFKCNLGMVRREYPVLGNWCRGLYWGVEGFRETTDWRHIKENYTKSHADINPLAITPLGPWPDIEEGFEREWGRVRVGGVKMPAVLEVQEGMQVPQTKI